MDEISKAIIARVVDRAPQWLRNDLAGKDAAARKRAEETIAAMIVDALTKGDERPSTE